MKYIAIDIETDGLRLDGTTIWMLSITRGKKTQLIEDCNGIFKLSKEVKKELEDSSVCKIVHSGVFDLPMLQFVTGCKVRNVWDTEVCETIIQGLRYSTPKKGIEEGSYEDKMLKKHSTKLMYVLPRYGFKSPDKNLREQFVGRPKGVPFTKELKEYAVGDTKFLPLLQEMQEYVLGKLQQTEVALLENKTTERISAMRVHGIGLNSKLWKKIADDNEREFDKRMKALPNGINWNSPAQVKGFFADRGVMLNSFDDMEDVYLETRDKMLGNFMYARELYKAVTSYGNNWFEEGFIDGDGRVRCHVTQCINTGRMSMSEPNLQQLPGETNKKPKHRRVMKMIAGGLFHWKHREAFAPGKGNVFVSGDFGGQEIGIMASAANEKLWLDAMLRGDDIHSLTASLINPVGWAQAKERGCTFPKKCKCKGHLDLREPAKITNFMLAYGGGADRLQDSIGKDLMSRIESRVFVGAHKRVTPSLTLYLERNGRDAVRTGVAYSADPYKRRRVLSGEEAWQRANQGKNTPIQAAGANMLKLAMISLPWELPIALVIHDQIILEVPKTKATSTQKVLKKVMEDTAAYITGIQGLIRVDPTIQMDITKQ